MLLQEKHDHQDVFIDFNETAMVQTYEARVEKCKVVWQNITAQLQPIQYLQENIPVRLLDCSFGVLDEDSR